MSFRATAPALVLAALLAACGGDDEDTATATSSTSSTTSTSAPGDDETTQDTAEPDLSEVDVTLTEVASLDQPLAMAMLPDGELLVAQKNGGVTRLSDEEQVLDISDDISTGSEQGLLGIAVHPDGDRLYLSFTNTGGDSEIHEWAIDDEGEPEPGSRRRVVEPVEQPASNHNGGHITFGPDGLLWWGLGDGGGGGDQYGNAQNRRTLLGSILRLNPNAGSPERVIMGVRNPWRFSFDSATGDLWVADVGQSAIEEITYLPAGQIDGANLGWPMLEGSRPYNGEDPPEDAVPPIHEYTHDSGISIAGGVVYRGSDIPELRGAYLFADTYTGFIRAIAVENGEVVEEVELVDDDDAAFVSFAEDADGEVYVLDLAGRVLRMESGS